MAEAILKSKNITGLEVKSAGIYAANGHDASDHVKKVLDDHSIPHQHHSSLLTKTEVDWADLIFTMTSSHKFAIVQQYPDVLGKVFTLKEFTGEEYNHDVVDPFGGNLTIYQKTYQELVKLIDQAIGKLKS